MAIYEEIYQMIFTYGVERKPKFSLFGNFNTGYIAYVLPINNIVSTEDGILVHNAGFLRATKGAAKLGRPSFIEYGGGGGRGKENIKISIRQVLVNTLFCDDSY